MTHYCENPLCENEATKRVFVSQEKAGDGRRWLCAACEEAFTWGVQHGSMATRETYEREVKAREKLIARLQGRLRRIVREAQFTEDDGAMDLGERLLEIEKLAAALLPEKGAQDAKAQ